MEKGARSSEYVNRDSVRHFYDKFKGIDFWGVWLKSWSTFDLYGSIPFREDAFALLPRLLMINNDDVELLKNKTIWSL